jgi:hypothetical protein
MNKLVKEITKKVLKSGEGINKFDDKVIVFDIPVRIITKNGFPHEVDSIMAWKRLTPDHQIWLYEGEKIIEVKDVRYASLSKIIKNLK